MRQIPDKPLAKRGRLPSDIDGDMPEDEYRKKGKQAMSKDIDAASLHGATPSSDDIEDTFNEAWIDRVKRQ